MVTRYREAGTSVAQRRLAAVAVWFVAMAGVVAMVGLVVGASSLLGSDDGGDPTAVDEPPPAVVNEVDITRDWPPGAYMFRLSTADGGAHEDGSGEFFGREFEFIYLAEQLGLDLTYWTDIDLHEQPEGVLRHNGLVSLGQD